MSNEPANEPPYKTSSDPSGMHATASGAAATAVDPASAAARNPSAASAMEITSEYRP